MGGRRKAAIIVQHPNGLSAPLRGPQVTLWKRVMREEAVRRQGGCCEYCREPLGVLEATADHATPLKHGGLTTPENIKGACLACNHAKGHMTEARFKQVIRNPPPGSSISILLANARFRIRARELLAHKRILAFVGLKHEDWR